VKNEVASKVELRGLDSLHKVGVFEDIKFSNDLHRIRFIQVSSEIDSNFLLVTVDGTVFKYDLATRELLFSFKTQAMVGLQLYNKDRRLLAADGAHMKLWEFVDDQEEAPELKTV